MPQMRFYVIVYNDEFRGHPRSWGRLLRDLTAMRKRGTLGAVHHIEHAR